MDHDLYDPTVRASIDDIIGTVENPGCFVEATPKGKISFVLDHAIIVAGSDEAADIKIEGRSMAPYHVEITFDEGIYQIRHVDGRAEVRVNGEAVDESVLVDGDSVAIGDRVFTFHFKPMSQRSD